MSLDFTLKAMRMTPILEKTVTHNMRHMALEAGIYTILWHPEENGYKTAGDIVEILEKGVSDMRDRPDHYKQFDPANGWGSYDDFLPWLEEVLECCKKNHDAELEAYA